MDSLLERIEENKLDALYLFINETLRDRQTFDVFLQNLVAVLPHNWSIQRVEVGHEFLSMVPPDHQQELFELICGLESLRTLIISDGYVPRKDNGSVHAEALLHSLPRARNLINLDLQRLQLKTEAQVQMLADAFASLSESLEEIRITSLVVEVETTTSVSASSSSSPAHEDTDENDQGSCASSVTPVSGGVLDGPIEQCIEMGSLRSLAISQKQQSPQTPGEVVKGVVSQTCLLNLCQNSTTLQDLALRNMNMDNATCQTLAKALTTNSFLTSLDLRQNDRITTQGYASILQALERNYDLWCTVMVDDESFQAKFNALIELNQANRGDLIRSPTKEKLAKFIGHLNDQGSDPTSLWYFLSIHENILFPLVEFMQWKRTKSLVSTSKRSLGTTITTTTTCDGETGRELGTISGKRPRFEE